MEKINERKKVAQYLLLNKIKNLENQINQSESINSSDKEALLFSIAEIEEDCKTMKELLRVVHNFCFYDDKEHKELYLKLLKKNIYKIYQECDI